MKKPLPGLPGGNALPWDGNSNPYMIAIQHNPIMDAYDVIVHIGGFKTEAEAQQAADWMAPAIQDLLGGTQSPAPKAQ